MGVKGLWKLLESVGRPVTLESLENKILGVDASVILNQAVKGMRDKQGNPVPNAHLVGLFSRLCKLLYYRIKPVFVFDGGVPHLKKKTLAARKEQRFKAVHKSKRAAEKIIKNYLKAKALETVTKRKSSAVPVRSRSPREPDVFELPPLPSSAVTDAKSSSEDEDMDIPILEQFHRQHLEETFQDPKAIDIDSEEFKALPPEIQHELIKDIREEKTWMSKNILPGQARDFSSFQLEGVLKRGKMNQRLEDLRKEMNQRNSGELTGIVSDETVGEENTVNSQKILSEDTAHYILIKRNEQEVKQSKDFSDEGGFFREDQEGEIVTWTNPRPKPVSPTKVPSFEIHDLCSSDSEILSPFLDVPEADLSPSNSQAQRGTFSFSPIKDKGRTENDELSMDENVTKITEAPIQKSQTYHTPLPGSEDAKSVDKKSKIDNLHDLSDHEAKVVFFGEDSDEDNELLTQIKDKKKELEDLLRKWKASKHQKTADDVITSSKDDHNVAEVNEIELLERSPESVEVFNVSERQPECYVIEETENTPSTLIIDDQTESKEKTVDTLHVCESESGTSSVEEIRVAVKSDEGLSDNLKISSSDTLQETRTSNPSFNIAEKEKRTLSTDSLPEIQILPSPNGDTTSDVIEDEKIPSSLDVQQEGQTTQSEDTTADTNQDPDNKVTQIVEKQDSAEKSGDKMDVGEPVPGPSGLPVEWRGATVEELEDIRLNIEAEQHSLASEQARQNRIAASLSNEMFAECQELLQLFGVPYLVSPMEAEAQCAALDILGLTEGSITDDSDIFLFGGRRVYKNIFNQNKHVEMYGSDSVLRNLALDRSNLICIAFITGSDYTEGVPGVGTVGAMELLHEFSGEGLEGLKKFKSWHEEVQKRTKHPQETKVKRKMRSVELPNDFPAEEVYEAYLHPVVDESTEQFEWGKPDLHSLRLFASDKFGWSSARTDEVLLPVLKQLNKDETQMKINNYFEVKFQETRTVKSKRVQRVLNRKFNPSSSNSEDGVENSKKQRQHGGETPSIKKNDKTEPNERKRTLSTKNSASKHDNEADAKRAKKSVDGDSACALTETRSSGRKRGRGRGRGKARERAEAIAELRLSIAPRSSNQVKRKQLYQENKERSRRTRSRSSTSADTEKETFVDQILENDKKRKKQQRSVVSKKKNDAKCIAEDDDSTSDTTDSEDNSENFYAGPKPVSVFVRGRGRASIWPTGRALRRGK